MCSSDLDDIRISDNILKQLSDAYRRIRNTCRFMLGNLSDFLPSRDAVPCEAMTDIDRYALHTLTALVEKGRKAYDAYEFHVVYHAMHNYCTVDLSAFYLDILKDRLYTSAPASPERRSAQTAMYRILDALVRLMAPILPFTAEEIWGYMPETDGREESVHLAAMPEAENAWKNEALARTWRRLILVRGEVTKALEAARAKKEIGHPLDARVTLNAGGEVLEVLRACAADLHTFFIVSKAEITTEPISSGFVSQEIEGLTIGVSPAAGEKCERCWVHDPSVGTFAQQPTLCSRCMDQIAAL